MHLVWHRADLRIHDHPGLAAAREAGAGMLPLVVLDPAIFERPTTTPRRQAWFLENTRALRAEYRARGGDLLVRGGAPAAVLSDLARRHGVCHVHLLAAYTPYGKRRDRDVARVLEEAGVTVHAYPGQYTHPPGAVVSESGARCAVFGAFKRRWDALPAPGLAPTPERLPPFPGGIEPGEIPRVDSDIPLPPPGEKESLRLLERFLRAGETDYAVSRDRPAADPGTSRLSYYFHLGVLSPRLAVQRARTAKWRFELAWWDFFADCLDRHPRSVDEEYRPEWRGFPWRYDEEETRLWREGQTGIPIVDAGMRELAATGFMHNRARMIAASFLTKHLLIDWRVGEAIFRSRLLCGDTAQNVGNWQWVAGCGVDAAPYFRVFNPVAQGERYDPEGEYVRRWVPEIAGMPAKYIQRPWEAQDRPKGYPPPMIDLAFGRQRFLEAARRHLAPSR